MAATATSRRDSCVRQVQQFDHGGRVVSVVNPPVSVAAVAARRIDRVQLLEVEFGNGLQLRRQPRPFEAGGQVVEPGAVFAARTGPFYEAGRFVPMPSDAAGLARALMARRNDLTDAAIGLVPEIGAVLGRLARLPGALLARMSGSGATCFALFPDRSAAHQARAALAAAEPQWWCAACGLIRGEAVAGQALRIPG